jgi:hypothetical protein
MTLNVDLRKNSFLKVKNIPKFKDYQIYTTKHRPIVSLSILCKDPIKVN